MSKATLLLVSSAAMSIGVLVAAPSSGTRTGFEASSLPAEVLIPNTRQIEFTSSVNGHRYSISVALPFERAPVNGYGVLYVLDGYSYFASAAEIVRGPANAPGVVVVGIGYPNDSPYLREVLSRRGPISQLFNGMPPSRVAPYFERNYDLTLPPSEQQLVELSKQGYPKWKKENFGGVDEFLKTIETEVKPRVSALVPINAKSQAIFGHSAGGSAVLHALLTEPAAFQTFIIASPGIYWDNKAVLANRQGFAAAVGAGAIAPRVLVTVGGEESSGADIPASWEMVENGRELVQWLKSLHGRVGYEVQDYEIFRKTPHSFSAWPALVRGVCFAFPNRRSTGEGRSDDGRGVKDTGKVSGR